MKESGNKSLIVNPEIASLVFLSEGEASHFFGYYGISPWNQDNSKLLAHKTRDKGPFIRQDNAVDLGWFNLDTAEFNKFEETRACNWQQGSLLRWLPQSNETVIFNRRDNNHFFARIMDLASGKIIDFSRPVHAVAPNGKFGLSLNVERLYYTRRAYSYEYNYGKQWADSLVNEDGIFKVDFVTKDARLIISTEELAQRDPIPTMVGAKHWLDHPLISPDSRKFLFYHRWMTNDGTFFTRLYTANVGGGGLKAYTDSGMYSHATWLSSDE